MLRPTPRSFSKEFFGHRDELTPEAGGRLDQSVTRVRTRKRKATPENAVETINDKALLEEAGAATNKPDAEGFHQDQMLWHQRQMM